MKCNQLFMASKNVLVQGSGTILICSVLLKNLINYIKLIWRAFPLRTPFPFSLRQENASNYSSLSFQTLRMTGVGRTAAVDHH